MFARDAILPDLHERFEERRGNGFHRVFVAPAREGIAHQHHVWMFRESEPGDQRRTHALGATALDIVLERYQLIAIDLLTVRQNLVDAGGTVARAEAAIH